jgi:hypothetical protein
MAFRIALPLLIGAAAMLPSCSSAKDGSMMNETRQSDYATALAECGDCPIQVIWWTRGGEPGPGYTSDKLTITAHEGLLTGVYVKTRFDPAYENSFRAIQYRDSLPRAAIEAMLVALRDDAVFDTHFKSEDRGNLADGIKDTLTATVDWRTFEKNMVATTADEIARAKTARNQIAALLEQARDQRDLSARIAN